MKLLIKDIITIIGEYLKPYYTEYIKNHYKFLEIVDYYPIGSPNYNFKRPTWIDCCQTGYLKGLIYLYNFSIDTYTPDVMDCAASNGYIQIVKFINENIDSECSKNAIDLASLHGHIHIVKYLYLNRSEGCTEYAMNYAAATNQLELVEWLNENTSEGCVYSALWFAIKNDCHDVVEYLKLFV